MKKYGLKMDREVFNRKVGDGCPLEHFTVAEEGATLEVLVGGSSDDVEDMDKAVLIESVLSCPQVASSCTAADFCGLYIS